MSVSVTLPDHKREFHSYGLFWQNVCVSVKLQQIKKTCNDINEIRKKSCFLSISLFRPDLNHFRRKDRQWPQIVVYIHCDIHI